MTAVELPPWAQVTEKRRGHIERVTALLMQWADALELPADERQAWIDAGRWHDALRDADEPLLRDLSRDANAPVRVLHGPAAAAKLTTEGEKRADVLQAIRWHTLGNADWGRVGQALYMADFLEPGRPFSRPERAFLATCVPVDFLGAFRRVVTMRVDWSMREGLALYPETVALWNRVR